MEAVDLFSEPQECRKWAVEFDGRPERSILLKLAEAFEELDEHALTTSEGAAGGPTPILT